MDSPSLDPAKTPTSGETLPSESAMKGGRRPGWVLTAFGGVALAGIILLVLGNWIIMPLVTRGSIVRVPDLYEFDVAVAKRALLDSDLVFINDSSDYVWDYDVPANHVVMQNPLPYTTVKTGRSVRVTVSRGPQLYPVPNVRDISPLQAKLRLQQQLFDVGTVTYILRTDNDRSEPFVKEQNPPPGAMLPRGTKVNLSVSIVPEMPDLTGRSLEEATQFIQLLGLQVGSVTFEESSDLLPRSVMSQSVPPGARIQAGDRVNLVASHL